MKSLANPLAAESGGVSPSVLDDEGDGSGLEFPQLLHSKSPSRSISEGSSSSFFGKPREHREHSFHHLASQLVNLQQRLVEAHNREMNSLRQELQTMKSTSISGDSDSMPDARGSPGQGRGSTVDMTIGTLERGKDGFVASRSTPKRGKGSNLDASSSSEQGKGSILVTSSTLERGRGSILVTSGTLDRGRRSSIDTSNTLERGRGSSIDTSSTLERGRGSSIDTSSTLERGRGSSIDTSGVPEPGGGGINPPPIGIPDTSGGSSPSSMPETPNLVSTSAVFPFLSVPLAPFRTVSEDLQEQVAKRLLALESSSICTIRSQTLKSPAKTLIEGSEPLPAKSVTFHSAAQLVETIPSPPQAPRCVSHNSAFEAFLNLLPQPASPLPVRRAMPTQTSTAMKRAEELVDRVEDVSSAALEDDAEQVAATPFYLHGAWNMADGELLEIKRQQVLMGRGDRNKAEKRDEKENYRSISLAALAQATRSAEGRFIWHPFSRSRLLWDITKLLILSYDLITVPMQAYILPALPIFMALHVIFALFWTLDIAASMLTGVFMNGELVMQPAMIARKYAWTWMVFDLVVLVPEWISSFDRVLGVLRFVTLLR
ncbi:unnamed protein product, partial [Polarella glacialis]